jgi:Fur family iron response transcriptional regulator
MTEFGSASDRAAVSTIPTHRPMTDTSKVKLEDGLFNLASRQKNIGDRPSPGFLDPKAKLQSAKLRRTRQRMALARLLFGNGNRHVTAEGLFEQAVNMKLRVSLATVYNTLHDFTKAGLLHEIPVVGSCTHFDTNTQPHHHFVLDETNELFDIPVDSIEVACLRDNPTGTEISRIDLVVRLRKVKTLSSR